LHNEEIHKFVRFTKCYYGDQIKEDEMGGLYSTYGWDEKWMQNGWSGNLKGRDHSEERGVDWKMTLVWILGK